MIEEMARANYLGEFELVVMLTVIRLGEAIFAAAAGLGERRYRPEGAIS